MIYIFFEGFFTLSSSETPLKEWNHRHYIWRAIWGTARKCIESCVFHTFTFLGHYCNKEFLYHKTDSIKHSTNPIITFPPLISRCRNARDQRPGKMTCLCILSVEVFQSSKKPSQNTSELQQEPLCQLIQNRYSIFVCFWQSLLKI